MGLIGKAFHSNFGFKGTTIPGWKAERLSSDSFRITRKNGSTRDVTIGDILENDSKVELLSHNCLKIGDYNIPLGDNDLKMTAMSIKKTHEDVNRYIIKHPDKKGGWKVNVGQYYEGLGKISENEYGNLHLSERRTNVLVIPKKYELSLVIFDQADEKGKGKSAFFNYIEPGNELNNRDGIKGTFFPSFKNRPAKFCERLTEDQRKKYGLENDKVQTLITAVFFQGSGTLINGKVRTLEDAIMERKTYLEVSELKKVIESDCERAGITKEDHPNIDLLKSQEQKLNYYNHDSYKVMPFKVLQGGPLFGADEPKKTRSHENNYDSYRGMDR